MENRKTALILSFIYCGLGQIYKRQIPKGISFIIIYTPLIAFFLLSHPSFALHFLNLSIIALMWLMGMADAYVDVRTIRWRKIMDILIFSVVSGAVVMLLILPTRISSAPDEQSAQIVTTTQKNSDTEATLQKADDTAIIYSLDPSVMRKNGALADVASPMVASAAGGPKPLPDQDAVFSYGDTYENVTIAAYSLRPVFVEPGATITINYTLDTSRAITVALGFSILRASASTWVNDSDNDKMVDIVAGGGNYSREFTLLSTLRPGEYHVAWGVWDQDFTTPYDARLSRNALIVVAPTTAEGQSGSPEALSNRVSN